MAMVPHVPGVSQKYQPSKRVKTNDGHGFTWVPDGPEVEFDIIVNLDIAGIARALARRAVSNKAKKTIEIGGAVVVTAIPKVRQ